ncbi:YggS family pyridoxal phosphate-dependent enzyme [Campylobacter sp. MIT 21-1685]|uniref:YggS family pyridoxal phosphate-dependent enzyme n=1 Tax=unclassified Campylobacter TaxID=2593542 RepID=UPI00224B5F2F|nr:MULTISPECIES: YggS family pyridoxal phosphate-dependent enzyme [unclassified Campylobacter]MCX2682732.1 YggS family pyridoxal phosphate-dependent enzyme [Campylobacter sp. MIT 21-1684]MCX2751122.1 YggS family pyridoxal phosphate-dependent enzyme [Campylobacter sp. MIT 21-1682]MCX2807213.1 YggS family pyridoxal phosphate-dependent enzyme [Campylobacter sp. MIT 21-1685]
MTLEQILDKTKNVRLVAASKHIDLDIIKELYLQGITDFGENQVQALANKKEMIQNEKIQWHFIGTLQRNKINLLLKQKPVLWHSCNSLKIAKAVNERLNYTLDTLLEINTANEKTKSGIESSRAEDEYLQIKEECPKLNLCGVMSIGSHSDKESEIAKSFETTFLFFQKFQKYGARICSMGMSNDFELAIKCGSNMVRLGSILLKSYKN